MTGCVLIRWGAGVAGREAKGLDVFGKAVARFEEYAKQGRVHGHREYFALTGGSGGFMIIDGEVEELSRILTEEETIRLNAQAEAIVQDFQIQLFAGGTDQATQQLMGSYVQSLQEIGYM
jgi:hypothetical protein